MTTANHLALSRPSVAPPARSSQIGELRAVLRRVEEAIDIETDAIRTDPDFDIAAANSRKSRHLFDLTRALKGLDVEELDDSHRVAITRLKGKLEVNEAAIKAHLQAVSEIAALVQTAIEQSEADGTYSKAEFGAYRR